MATLFTVIMNRKIIRTTYERGKACTDEAQVEEKYCDLPYITAMSYKSKFPDACIDIIPQTTPTNDHRNNIKVSERNRGKGNKNERILGGYRPKVNEQLVRDGHVFNEAKSRASDQDAFAEVVNKMMSR